MTPDVSESTFVHLLETRAQQRPHDTAFVVDGDARSPDVRITYAELAAGARRVAAGLTERSLAGMRLILLLPPGVDYIVALFGCWYAGVTAVPLYPLRQNASMRRFHAIAHDCSAAAALIGADSEILSTDDTYSNIEMIRIDAISNSDANSWKMPKSFPNQLALLQYTSGSTGIPKGVRLLHRHLTENIRILTQVLGTSRDSVGVTWLPPYHDMGLIGGLLQPLHAGYPVHVMSPATFMQRPVRWLEAITRHRATVSAAPNFAFDLCVRRATPEQIATLDLSSLRAVCNGAEPVRADTLRRFCAAFAPARFDARAFLPCFGLAEATLLVTGAPVFTGAIAGRFNRTALGIGKIESAMGDTDVVELVGSGCPAPGVEVTIVDPVSIAVCPPGRIGEIWVTGDTVADGYWQRPDATAETFESRLPGDQRQWLRTGDLGALHDGQLFVTGRIKDLIVIRGHNHYPQDIEATALAAHPALRPRGAAAFSIDAADGETLALVLELERGSRTADLDAVRVAVTGAVSREHQLQIGTLAFVAANGVPKTSSGKVQRRETRARLLAGELVVVDTGSAA